jgi:L-ascorbate metabolism protein UlaG (beta-lactamase superfamily)
MMLISSPQVVKRLGLDGDNVSSVWPEKGEVLKRSGAGIQVEFMQFSHGRRQHANVENLAQVIHLGGYTVLHLGDAAMEELSFSIYDLSQRWFDVAIVPYWFFEFAPGQAIVRRQINANHIIAAHIPPAKLEEVKAMLAKDWPDVIVFDNALDSRTF